MMTDRELRALLQLATEAVALLDFRKGDMSTDAYLGLVEDFKRRAAAALPVAPTTEPVE